MSELERIDRRILKAKRRLLNPEWVKRVGPERVQEEVDRIARLLAAV